MTIDLRRQHHPAAPIQPEAGPPEVHHATNHRTASNRRKERAVAVLIAGALAIAFIVLLGDGVTRVWRYVFSGSEAQLATLISDIGDHMLVPEDETPTLATVSDMHALEGQEFFKHAQEGDMVLMYLQARKAIIYRPSIDKIIEVGPITGGEQ